MPECSPPPPDYVTTHDDVLGSPILCTVLFTLIMFSSLKSDPASPWWRCNKTSAGKVHHCSAG